MIINQFGKMTFVKKSNRVTISNDTINKLEKMGKPFESIDSCLNRILSCSCVEKEMKKQHDDVESEKEE